jgi:hypothetical protein
MSSNIYIEKSISNDSLTSVIENDDLTLNNKVIGTGSTFTAGYDKIELGASGDSLTGSTNQRLRLNTTDDLQTAGLQLYNSATTTTNEQISLLELGRSGTGNSGALAWYYAGSGSGSNALQLGVSGVAGDMISLNANNSITCSTELSYTGSSTTITTTLTTASGTTEWDGIDITITYGKVGNTVTVHFYSVGTATVISTTGNPQLLNFLPAGYRPLFDVLRPCLVARNGTNSNSVMRVTTSGTLIWYGSTSLVATGTWTTGTGTFYQGCITFLCQ